MFPSAHARVYRNEAGEVMGWDDTAYDEPDYDPDDYLNPEIEDEEEDEPTTLKQEREGLNPRAKLMMLYLQGLITLEEHDTEVLRLASQ